MTRILQHSAIPSAISRLTPIALLVVVVTAAGCGGGGSETPADRTVNVTATATTSAGRGEFLYATTGASCVQCHTNASTMSRGASDALVLADRIAAAIAANTGRMGDAQYGYANFTRTDL